MLHSFLILLLLSSLAHAKEIVLIQDNGRAVQRYDTLVEQVKKGDTIAYPDGSVFTVLEKLQGGGTNKIYRARLLSTGEVGILRVPVEREALDFATETLLGYPLLEEQQVPIPKLMQGVKRQYVFQEEIPVQLTARDLFDGNLKTAKLSEKELFSRLLLFMKQTARFRRLADLTPQNVAFDGERWLALDWQGDHALIAPGKFRSLMSFWLGEDNDRPLVRQFWKEASEVIAKTREENPAWMIPCPGFVKASLP